MLFAKKLMFRSKHTSQVSQKKKKKRQSPFSTRLHRKVIWQINSKLHFAICISLKYSFVGMFYIAFRRKKKKTKNQHLPLLILFVSVLNHIEFNRFYFSSQKGILFSYFGYLYSHFHSFYNMLLKYNPFLYPDFFISLNYCLFIYYFDF